jgi:hypothetical protein
MFFIGARASSRAPWCSWTVRLSSISSFDFGLCSYIGHTSVTYAPSELTLTHVTNVRSILCRPSRVHLKLSSRAIFSSCSSRAIFLSFLFELLFSSYRLEVPDVLELLGSGSSRALPLACTRCCFFSIGLSRWLASRALGPSGSGLRVYYSQHPLLNSSLAPSSSRTSTHPVSFTLFR